MVPSIVQQSGQSIQNDVIVQTPGGRHPDVTFCSPTLVAQEDPTP
jgi:hypothetical protein